MLMIIYDASQKIFKKNLEIFNFYDFDLKFTIKTEVDQKMNYLETLMKRNAYDIISTNWYQKAIALN